MIRPESVKALLFDVFGTCVDWRGSITKEGPERHKRVPRGFDWAAFADAWRGMYQPAMERVRSGERPFVNLDRLHREGLDALARRFKLDHLGEADLADLTRAWHRLDPWPDVVAGLTRLKAKFTIAPLSNGNVALLNNMAKRAGLPWDLILSTEIMRRYKPQPEAYLGAVALLGIGPGEAMMVAAHNNDLAAASALGLRTAFVPRPQEHGPGQKTDLGPESPWDIVAPDFGALADALGC
jgi:2-haloacid dehalogenase